MELSQNKIDMQILNYPLSENKQIKVSRLEDKHVMKYFATHRHQYYEIVLIMSCDEGEYSHEVDFISYPLKPGAVYFIAPGQTHAWNTKTYNKEYRGFLITFNESFLVNSNKTLETLLAKLFNPLDITPFISYNPTQFEQTFPTLHILEKEYNKELPDYFVMRSLLESLIYYMIKLKSQSSQRPNLNYQRLVDIKKIIELHYKEEKNVEFYARKMELSAKHLNEISKKTTGKTVTQLIHHRLILEAKREMVVGTKTIQTISDELGFESASYFARFFKKQESMSPTEFSKQLFK